MSWQLSHYKENGEDVEILEKNLCQLKISYDKTFDFIAVDDKKVNDFIEDYNCIETEIVQREQNAFSDHGLLGGYRIIAEMKEKVQLWGTANDKLKFDKLEEAYLTQYNNIREARASIDQYIHTYNFERRHSALDYQTPAECYYPVMLMPYVA